MYIVCIGGESVYSVYSVYRGESLYSMYRGESVYGGESVYRGETVPYAKRTDVASQLPGLAYTP